MRMRLFPITLFFLLPALLYSEEGVAVLDYSVVPTEYSIGDEITVRIELAGADNDALPFFTETDKWIDTGKIEQVLQKGKIFLFIPVVTYYPGEKNIPPINFGGATLTGFTLKPRPLIDGDEQEIEPVRETLLLPNTRLIIFSWTLGFVFLCGFVYLLYRKGAEYGGAVGRFFLRIVKRAERKRYLKDLANSVGEDAPAKIMKKTVQAVKDIVKSEFGCRCETMTVTELTFVLSSLSVLHPISEVLDRSNGIIYGERFAEPKELAELVETAVLFNSWIMKNRREIVKAESNVRF